MAKINQNIKTQLQKSNKVWAEQFTSLIFGDPPFNFTEKALELFYFQYKNNAVYRNYCQLIHCDPSKVDSLKKIPFLPISAFKTHKVVVGNFEAEAIFTSSGTTGNISSRHFVNQLKHYENSFQNGFELFYGDVSNYCVVALLPSYLEREGSSLVYMVNDMIKSSRHPDSGFFLNNQTELKQLLEQLAEKKQKTLLIGVSFGLLDFVESQSISFHPDLIVMETGGMKGRKKEMVREELHQILGKGFQQKKIHSEYGMTELLSQAYSKGHGKFETPPWMKILIRHQDDPFSYLSTEKTGAINIIDLANVHSCAFIQTDDLGKSYPDGSFEVLGRFDVSDLRGCNLMVV